MEHAVLLLGSLIGIGALVAIGLKFLRQSTIIAFILVGVVAGMMKHHVHIPHEIVDVFQELGIILLLFMAGLELEFKNLKKRWKIVLAFGTGQIFINLLLAILLGYIILDTNETIKLVYFGLCLTLSSTIIVLGVLREKKAMESFQGQIILGLMVLQDIAAVTALTLLKSLTSEGNFLVSLGMMVLKLVVLALALGLVSKFFAQQLFRFFAKNKDMMFMGTLGWALGISAICEMFHMSPEIGAFLAGAALSILPYKLEIQDKVEPMKDFGVILFFLILGYNLHIDRSVLSLLPKIAIIIGFVLFVTPVIIILISYLEKVKSRPTFFIGVVINQISEFSLILATLCAAAGIFDQETLTLIILSTIGTIFLSCFGHQLLDGMYNIFKSPLRFLDASTKVDIVVAQSEGFELKDHVIIIKYNELAETYIEYYLSAGKRVVLVDLDPEVFEVMKTKDPKLLTVYGDVFDPDLWEEAGFDEAYCVISCLIEGQSAELGILNWLKERNSKVPFLAATDSRMEALELYEHGATFVIQTEDLAAVYMMVLLKEYGNKLNGLIEKGREYRQSLKTKMSFPDFKFT